VAARIHSHGAWGRQLGGGGGAVVAAVAGRARACDGDDGAGRLDHLADDVVAGVSDEQIAAAVHHYAGWGRELGGGGRAVVASVAGHACAREAREDRPRVVDAQGKGAADGGAGGVLHRQVDVGERAGGGRGAGEGDGRPGDGWGQAGRQVGLGDDGE